METTLATSSYQGVLLLGTILLSTHVTTAVDPAVTCSSGKELDPDGSGVCVSCPVGYYRDVDGMGEEGASDRCAPCPEGFTTRERGAGKKHDCDVIKGGQGPGPGHQINMQGSLEPYNNNKTTNNTVPIGTVDIVGKTPPAATGANSDGEVVPIETVDGNDSGVMDGETHLNETVDNSTKKGSSETNLSTETGGDGDKNVPNENVGKNNNYDPMEIIRNSDNKTVPLETAEEIERNITSETVGDNFRDPPTGSVENIQQGLDQVSSGCPGGTELDPGGAGVCVACRIGYYRDVLEEGMASSCRRCQEGYVTLERGAGKRHDCDVIIGDRHSCPSGTEWVGAGQECRVCDPGSYRTQYVDYWCYRCPDGSNTTRVGAHSISECTGVKCASGTEWSNQVGKCQPCLKGFYRPRAEEAEKPGTSDPSDILRAECLPCPAGYTTLHRGSADVDDCWPTPAQQQIFSSEDCPSGTEWNTTEGACIVCKMNTYRDRTRDVTCRQCPGNSYTLKEGAVSSVLCNKPELITKLKSMMSTEKPVECPTGTEWRESPAGCHPCPGGTYRIDLSKKLCQFCPKSSRAAQPERCNGVWPLSLKGICPPGTTYDGVLNYCRVCTYGLYSKNQECVFCTERTMTIATASTSSEHCVLPSLPAQLYPYFNKDQCTLGTEWNYVVGGCTPCPKGYHRQDFNSPSCIMCSQTYTTMSTGTKTSLLCNVKRQGPEPMMVSVDGCEPGYELVDNNSECMMCARGSYKSGHGPEPCIQCPKGSGGVAGRTMQKGSTQFLDCIPVFNIISVEPPFGVESGGTVLTVKVDVMDEFRVERITVGRRPCDLMHYYASKGTLRCVTSPTRGSGELGTIRVELPSGTMYSSKNDIHFEYRPDPVVTSIGRMSGIASGGVNVSIYGENLNSVAAPKFILHKNPPSAMGDDAAEADCVVVSPQLMQCLLPDLTPLMRPKKRRKRQTAGADDAQSFTPGLVLGGLPGYGNLSNTMPGLGIFSVYPDPVIEPWDDIMIITASDPSLKIQGTNLDKALKIEDYTVEIGPCSVKPDAINSEYLYIQACRNLKPRDLHEAKVMVGRNLEFTVGKVRRVASSAEESSAAPTQSEDDDNKLIIIPVIIATILVLAVICMAVLIYIGKRRKRAHEEDVNRLAHEYMVQEARLSVSSVDAHLPPLPVDSVFGPERVTDKGVAMRAIALPDDDSLSVIESSSPGSRKLLRYRVEYAGQPDQLSSGYNSTAYGAEAGTSGWRTGSHISPTPSYFSYF